MALAELWPGVPLCRAVLGRRRRGPPGGGDAGWGLPEDAHSGRVTLCALFGTVGGIRKQHAGTRSPREARCALVPRAPQGAPRALPVPQNRGTGGPPARPGQGGDRGGLTAPSVDLSLGPEAALCGQRPPGNLPGPHPTCPRTRVLGSVPSLRLAGHATSSEQTEASKTGTSALTSRGVKTHGRRVLLVT